MENKFIHAAVNYVNKGQMKVFPLQPGSKEPYAGSRGFKDASDDVMTVTQWWEERPDSNIGVATGGFFWVLDIDIKSGGIESLDKLLAEHQDGEQLYTFTVKSGGGGYHYYFYYEKDATTGQPKYTVPRSVGKIAPGIDVIAEGSYIIGAHSKTENLYLPLTDLQDMDTAPDWLLQLAMKAGATPVSDVANDDGVIEPGNRNETLTSLAGSLRRVGNDSTQIKKILSEVNTNALSEPLPDREVDTIARSVARYQPDENRIKEETIDEAALDALDVNTDRSFTSDFPPGFLTDWVELCSKRSDAAPEYSELVGLAALGVCSPNVYLPTNFSAKGISTNVYGLIVGTSARARKSTTLKFLTEILDDVLPELEVPARSTPEALGEQLAMRNGKGAIQIHDEFTQEIIAIQQKQYKAGMIDIYLQMFDKGKYIQQRHSKRGSDGEQKVDADRVIDPHFNLLGACTGTIFDSLSTEHIESGLLNRFLIAYPERLPPRMAIGDETADVKEERIRLGTYLKNLYDYCRAVKITCKMTAKQYALLDAFAHEMEDTEEDILQRLNIYSFRLAILIQLSIEIPRNPVLAISDYAVSCAIKKCRMYVVQLQNFAASVGGMSPWERKNEAKMASILTKLTDGPKKKSYLSRSLHIQADPLSKLGDTLEEREQIVRTKMKTKGKHAEVWSRVL